MNEFKLPDPGEGLLEADIVSWKVAVGDTVAVNDILLEIETAKSLVELPSPYAGVVLAILADEGANIENVDIADHDGLYTAITFNPEETAENLRKYGGFLPGIRPGKRTAEYLDYVLTRLTVIGAAYITIVCLMPEALIGYFKAPFYLGGTSILIVVSVTMDTVTQIQSHLLAHQYEGLINKSKLRGGRAR